MGSSEEQYHAMVVYFTRVQIFLSPIPTTEIVNVISLDADSFDGFLREKYPGPGRISLQGGTKNPGEKLEEKTKIERHRVRESKMEINIINIEDRHQQKAYAIWKEGIKEPVGRNHPRPF